jgi:tetratricopeptide (TPR) repeat protein
MLSTKTLKIEIIMQKQAIWNLLQDANASENITQFAQICHANSDLIERYFDDWRVVPENIRNNESAINKYGQTLISIATYFNTELGRPALINALQGKEAENPFEKLSNVLNVADELAQEQKFQEAIDYVCSFLESVKELTGNGIHRINALCFGRLGDMYYRIGDIENALNYNNYALVSCFQYGDVEGIFNYFENLYFIHNTLKNYSDAEDWANDACSFALENNFSSQIPKWLIRIAELQLESDRYPLAIETLVKVFNATNEVQKDDMGALSVSLNNCAELFRMNKKFEDAKPLYLNAIELRRKADLYDVILGQFLHNLAYLYLEVDKLDLVQLIIEEYI